jgi:hypothetical protein
MFGTIILFVLLTPGILLPRTFYGLPRLAVATVYGVLLAYLLRSYYSIPILNMIEPFQAGKKKDNDRCSKDIDCMSGYCAAKGKGIGVKYCQPKPAANPMKMMPRTA